MTTTIVPLSPSLLPFSLLPPSASSAEEVDIARKTGHERQSTKQEEKKAANAHLELTAALALPPDLLLGSLPANLVLEIFLFRFHLPWASSDQAHLRACGGVTSAAATQPTCARAEVRHPHPRERHP